MRSSVLKRLQIAVAAILPLALSACVSPAKMYSGEELSDTQTAIYFRQNFAEFSGPQIFTLALDGRDVIKNPPPTTHTRWILAPGPHTVRVSFSDADHLLFPAFLTLTVFQGWYDIPFDAKPGKMYAPVFDLNAPKALREKQMCIAELSRNQTLDDSRTPQPYVACAAPTIEPTPENVKVCQQFNGLNRPPSVFADFCHMNH